MVTDIDRPVGFERGQLLGSGSHGGDAFRTELELRHPNSGQVGPHGHVDTRRAQFGIELRRTDLPLHRKRSGDLLLGMYHPIIVLIQRQHHRLGGPQVELARQRHGSGRPFGHGDGVDTHPTDVGGFVQTERDDTILRIDVGSLARETFSLHAQDLQHHDRIGNVVPDTGDDGQYRQHQQQTTESVHLTV